MKAPAYIGVGSNIGDRSDWIKRARDRIVLSRGVRFLRAASIYETEPVGVPSQGKYLNTVWEIETEFAPHELLTVLQKIEIDLGRQEKGMNAARTIDLDILLMGNRIVREPDIVIPHPRFHERWFVLKPLSELCPDMIHPVLKKNVRDLLAEVEK